MKSNKPISFILILLFLLFGNCSNSSSQVNDKLPTLIPFRHGQLWGFCDKNKKIIIPCRYAAVEFFDKNGLSLVYKEDVDGGLMHVCGLVDSTGRIVVPVKYNPDNFYYGIMPYDGGRADKYGIYDAYEWNGKLVYIRTSKNMIMSGAEQIMPLNLEDIENTVLVNRAGKNLLGDSLTVVGLYPWFETVKYIAARNKSDKKVRIYDTSGRQINRLVFDKVTIMQNDYFVGLTNKVGGGIYTWQGESIITGNYEFRSPQGEFIKVNDEKYFHVRKRKFVGEGFHNAHYHYRIFNDFIIVPKQKGKIVSYSILNNELNPLSAGEYKSIDVDTVFRKIILYSQNHVTCIDYGGRVLFNETDADTIVPVSENRLFIRKSSGCGIWSVTDKKYVIQPLFKMVNYSMFTRYILVDQSDKCMVTDSNGGYSSADIYKEIAILYEQVDWIYKPMREIRQMQEPFSAYISGTYSGIQSNNSARFMLLTEVEGNVSMERRGGFRQYRHSDYYTLMRQYVASFCYIVAEAEDGTFYVIDGAGKKLMLGKARVYIRKFGNLVVSQNGTEINGITKNSGPFTFKSMDGKDLPALTCDRIGKVFYQNGKTYIPIERGSYNAMKTGVLVAETGEMIVSCEYDEIKTFGPFGDLGFIAQNSTGSIVYQEGEVLLKTGNGLIILDWMGEWGIATKQRGKSNSTGVVDKTGKIVVPLNYEISHWIDNGILIEVGIATKTGYVNKGYYDLNGNHYFDD